MGHRADFQKIIPDIYELLHNLDQLVAESGIEKLHLALIKIRASQINGCSYPNLHLEELQTYGKDTSQIDDVLAGWQEARNWFCKEDQVVLALTDAVTLIAGKRLSDDVYDESVSLFGEEMTIKLISAIVIVNARNRLGT
jgi:AhpD family alkylhydroperoxidase